MHRRKGIFPIFLLLFFLSLLFIGLAQKDKLSGITGAVQFVFLPIQRFVYQSYSFFFKSETKGDLAKLQKENSLLLDQLTAQKELEKENQALRDQFGVSVPAAKTLLPAEIIGGTTDTIIIDIGSDKGLKTGNVVVYKDNLIGKIIKTSPHLSEVGLLINKDISFTGVTVKTTAMGVVKGEGGDGYIFDNVVLSDKLNFSDIVLTKGDINNSGAGFPPHLVVGKIVSVNKKTSALFQSAELESLVDVSRLDTVFVIKQ